jgi:ABC-type glycerol-3-phosphate transport system permease component
MTHTPLAPSPLQRRGTTATTEDYRGLAAPGYSPWRYRLERYFSRLLLYLAVALFLFVVLLPCYWILISSLTPKYQMFSIPPRWIPSEITFKNYVNLVNNIPFFGYYFNSLIFAFLSSLVSVVLSFMAAYALARVRFRGSNIIFMLFIVTIAIPQIGTLVPLFELYKSVGLINNRGGMILLMSSLILPFTVWTLVSFIKQLPEEVEEAARIDGANLAQVLWRVVVPVVRPAIGTMIIINFIISWNELLYPLVFATSTATKTLSVGLMELAVDPSMGAGRPWDLMSALSVSMIIPVLLVVLIFQRLIVSGLTKGAIK